MFLQQQKESHDDDHHHKQQQQQQQQQQNGPAGEEEEDHKNDGQQGHRRQTSEEQQHQHLHPDEGEFEDEDDMMLCDDHLGERRLDWRMNPIESFSDLTLEVRYADQMLDHTDSRENNDRIHKQEGDRTITAMTPGIPASAAQTPLETTTTTATTITTSAAAATTTTITAAAPHDGSCPMTTTSANKVTRRHVYHLHKIVLAFGPRKCEYFTTLFQSQIMNEHDDHHDDHYHQQQQQQSQPQQQQQQEDLTSITYNNKTAAMNRSSNDSLSSTSTSGSSSSNNCYTRIRLPNRLAADAFPIVLDFLYGAQEPSTTLQIDAETATALHYLGHALHCYSLVKTVRQFLKRDILAGAAATDTIDDSTRTITDANADLDANKMYMDTTTSTSTTNHCHVYYHHANIFRDKYVLNLVIKCLASHIYDIWDDPDPNDPIFSITDIDFWILVLECRQPTSDDSSDSGHGTTVTGSGNGGGSSNTSNHSGGGCAASDWIVQIVRHQYEKHQQQQDKSVAPIGSTRMAPGIFYQLTSEKYMPFVFPASAIALLRLEEMIVLGRPYYDVGAADTDGMEVDEAVTTTNMDLSSMDEAPSVSSPLTSLQERCITALAGEDDIDDLDYILQRPHLVANLHSQVTSEYNNAASRRRMMTSMRHRGPEALATPRTQNLSQSSRIQQRRQSHPPESSGCYLPGSNRTALKQPARHQRMSSDTSRIRSADTPLPGSEARTRRRRNDIGESKAEDAWYRQQQQYSHGHHNPRNPGVR